MFATLKHRILFKLKCGEKINFVFHKRTKLKLDMAYYILSELDSATSISKIYFVYFRNKQFLSNRQ